MHPAVDRRVLRRRLQVLADRHDVDAVLAQVAQRVHDLVVRLAEPDDDPGLREHLVVGDLLRAREKPEGLVVVGLRAAHLAVEPADGLDVVVEDLGPRAEHDPQGLLLDAEEVRRQHLDRCLGQLLLQRADRRRVVAGAPVGDVVAVDRGDDDVLEPHLRRRMREAQRLERVGRLGRAARVDVAVAARAGARVAEDLERRGAASPALGDVGAARLLADRVELLPVDQLADLEVAAVRARGANLHPFRPARPLGYGQRRFHAAKSR